MTTETYSDAGQEAAQGTPQSRKIGLAVSGGGFRASIFHLGVIRRLEELGIMKNLAEISAVSGGSIIAAYYVIEMERRLQTRQGELNNNPGCIDAIRLEIFEGIAEDFFTALDHNLRSRALIFSPFYHPIKWFKCLFPGFSRSDLMQKEYDRWFFHGNNLDQLPSVTSGAANVVASNSGLPTGPKLILNTTSLMTGERMGFFREPGSGFNEMTKVNKNVLELARIVGASSAVPGLFPPTPVSGVMLVDGGVVDNQGIDALIPRDDKGQHIENDGFDLLLVSDASGQFEQVHRVSSRAAAVLNRTTSILQFQVRNKQLDVLRNWKNQNGNREFAFVHLFLDLKDRRRSGTAVPQVPPEYISPLGRIRTDLDQFSFIEREALMYHGYTLIDAQIDAHCPKLKGEIDHPDLKLAPLFRDPPGDSTDSSNEENSATPITRHQRIKAVLEAGRTNMFWLRSIKKHPLGASAVVALTWLIPMIVLYLTEVYPNQAFLTETIVKPYIVPLLKSVIPVGQLPFLPNLQDYVAWPITATGLTVLIFLGLLGYLLAFWTYSILRRLVRRWELEEYKNLTGEERPSTHWK